MRDAQRAKVYAAEEFVRTLFDRADGRGSLDFFGTALTLPPETRFGSVDAVRRYVEDVLALPAVRQRWPAAGTCAVRSRRGVTAAHYEPGMIAVPDGQSRWALRELVVFSDTSQLFIGYIDSSTVVVILRSFAVDGGVELKVDRPQHLGASATSGAIGETVRLRGDCAPAPAAPPRRDTVGRSSPFGHIGGRRSAVSSSALETDA